MVHHDNNHVASAAADPLKTTSNPDLVYLRDVEKKAHTQKCYGN
jgi:hypothetical protein